jgi:hypothetical protein
MPENLAPTPAIATPRPEPAVGQVWCCTETSRIYAISGIQKIDDKWACDLANGGVISLPRPTFEYLGTLDELRARAEPVNVQRVTAGTLTDRQVKTAEMLELTGRVYYQMRHEHTVESEHYKAQWMQGLDSLAKLINESREEGHRDEREKWQAENERLQFRVEQLEMRIKDALVHLTCPPDNGLPGAIALARLQLKKANVSDSETQS